MYRPRVIGLTGGIASGKTTVANILRKLGAPVVDADEVARVVVEPGTEGLRRLIDGFGTSICNPDGTLNRGHLGKQVFADPAARARVDAIVHPLIATEAKRQIDALAKQGHHIIVYDAALLIETGVHKTMDALIVVSVPPEIQRQRLHDRDGLTEAEITSRLQSQLPLCDKVDVADYIIDNSGDIDNTRDQVSKVWLAINKQQRSER